MVRNVDNNGIGALYATFEITDTGGVFDLDADDTGSAVHIADNNKINHGADGGQVVGRLEHVVSGLATVQVTGVVRFGINTGKTAPNVGDGVVLDGAGKVYQAPAIAGGSGDPAGGNIARGLVLAVDNTNNTCDVLL